MYILVIQLFQMVYHGIFLESLVFSQYTHEPLREFVYQENAIYMWGISQYATREYCITILYHAIENTVDNTTNVICAQHIFGCNTVKYATASLCSDWLYFLRHAI